MVNYNFSKIYKVTNSLNDEIYIGSTTLPYLCSRMNIHRMNTKDISGRRESKLYKMMRGLGIENFKIELIEDVKCDNKKDLHLREQYYIDLLKPSLNMTNPKPRTKEEISEYKKQWLINKNIKDGKEIKPKEPKTKEQRDQEIKEYKRKWYFEHRKEGVQNKENRNKYKDENYVREYKREWMRKKREQKKSNPILN